MIEQIPPMVTPSALAGKERDVLVMTAEERRWGRRRVVTASGREIALALPTGVELAPGAIIAVADNWFLEIEAAQEAVLLVRLNDREMAIRIAFEVGNLHFPLALDGDEMLVPDNVAVERLLDRLGVGWERRRAAFVPIARGHSHDR